MITARMGCAPPGAAFVAMCSFSWAGPLRWLPRSPCPSGSCVIAASDVNCITIRRKGKESSSPSAGVAAARVRKAPTSAWAEQVCCRGLAAAFAYELKPSSAPPVPNASNRPRSSCRLSVNASEIRRHANTESAVDTVSSEPALQQDIALSSATFLAPPVVATKQSTKTSASANFLRCT